MRSMRIRSGGFGLVVSKRANEVNANRVGFCGGYLPRERMRSMRKGLGYLVVAAFQESE